MASLTTRGNGTRFIQFTDANGDRKTIYVERMPKHDAKVVLGHVEALAAAQIARSSWDRKTAEWVGELGSVLYDKLAAVGLVPKKATPERKAIGPFIEAYIAKRTKAKPSTITNLKCVQRELVEFLPANRALADVTEADAQDFRQFLGERLAENTIRRHCSRARQFFAAAVNARLIPKNPFSVLKGLTVQANAERFRFVTQGEITRVLNACPDDQWRVIVALARHAGLRTPSETLLLRWRDVDWENKRMTVTSPKTEHFGKGTRTVPIFPKLRPYLEAARDASKGEAEFVVTRYRDSRQNLRTQFERIIVAAGLVPWPKPFQNLRSSCETELVGEHDLHAVTAWLEIRRRSLSGITCK